LKGWADPQKKLVPNLEAIAGQMRSLSPNPTEEQKNEIFEASARSMATSFDFMRSQP
jgi:hypothetical protein